MNKTKEELLNEKQKLEEEIKKLEQPAEFGNDVDSMEEETEESEEWQNKMSMIVSLKERLAEIEGELRKKEDH